MYNITIIILQLSDVSKIGNDPVIRLKRDIGPEGEWKYTGGKPKYNKRFILTKQKILIEMYGRKEIVFLCIQIF